MMQELRIQRRTESLLLLAAFIWGVNYPVAKYGLSGLNVFLFNAIRYVVATLFLIAMFALLRQTWQPIARRDWWKIIGIGFVGNVLYQIAFVVGLSLTTAGNSAVLLATAPLWTLVIDARVR